MTLASSTRVISLHSGMLPKSKYFLLEIHRLFQVDEFLKGDSDVDVLTRSVNNLSLASSFDRNEPVNSSLLSDLRIITGIAVLTSGKLREALISLRKEDAQAYDILLASVKVGILSQHGETYLPSLRTLLEHPNHPSCIHGWYGLYLLFILEAPYEFYAFTSTHPVDPYYMHLALAMVNGNYIAYTKILGQGSRFDKTLIKESPGDLRMKKLVVEVVGKCYYRVDVAWFNSLSKTDRWRQEGNMYIIRRQQQQLQKAS